MTPIKKEKTLFIFWLLLSLFWVIFIFAHSLKPAEASARESLGVLSFLQSFFPDLSHHLVRKLGHFAEFTLLGFFCSQALCRGGMVFKEKKSPTPGPCILYALIWGLVVAACDEWIQTNVPGRSGKITDVLLDMSGVITGVLISLCIIPLLRKKKSA